MEKMYLIIAIGAFAFFAILPGQTTQAQSVNDSMMITRERTTFDNNIRTQIIDAKDKQGRNFRMVIENDVMKKFFVNEKKVPIENIMGYKPVVKKTDDQLYFQHQMQQQSSREHYVQDSLMFQADMEKGQRDAEMQQQSIRARYSKDSLNYIADIMERGKRYGYAQLPSKWERDIYDSLMYQADMEKGKRDAERQQQSIRARYSKDSLNYLADIMEKGKRYGEMQLPSKWERDIYDSLMYQAALKESKRRELEQEKIVNELIRDTIIKDRASLTSFWLGAGSFIVNGENQSFEVYDRYKSKYIKTPDDVYSFNVPMRKN
jgi:hypothetical protein